MFAKLTAIAALFTLAAPVARGAVHNVTVGGTGILKYDPEFINADPGDEIIFTFKQKNHTVTQSSLNSPCVALQDGFDSGFVPVADDMTDNFPVAQYQVKDTNPVWVYCRQTGHCQQGMVFAVNPGDNLAAFQANAVGGASGTSSVAASTAAATTSAAQGAPSVVTVTATVTVNGQTETTTYGSYPGSAAPTAVASQDHLIVVGDNNTLTFSPNNISAQVGDTITFKFSTKNHTATQSSFADPCSPLSASSTSGQVGFDSGFMPAAGAATPPTFTVTVNDTAPIWVYCKQTNPASHCAAGMVFSANAIESGPNNFGAFQAKAKASGGTSPSASGSSSSAAPSSTDANNGAARIGESGWGAGVLVAALTALAGSLVL
ncbi:Cupredoxin [Lenzites betulinus]|nr:Cupredoxin [Lenzites betulinus]